jgi:hypothetical protein
MKKWRPLLSALLLLCLLTVVVYFKRSKVESPAAFLPPQAEPAFPVTKSTDTDHIEQEMNRLLSRPESSERTLAVPPTPKPSIKAPSNEISTVADTNSQNEPDPPPPVPMGVVLLDQTPAYAAVNSTSSVMTLRTGDLLEIKPETAQAGRLQGRTHVDVLIAGKRSTIVTAGTHYPDRLLWLSSPSVQVLPIEQAITYTRSTELITLGNDPDFSTFDFYLRALKNPDPVVHRIVGARLVRLLSLHQEYNPTWEVLIHDSDPYIADLALKWSQKRLEGR